jgi:hypothetical protein
MRYGVILELVIMHETSVFHFVPELYMIIPSCLRVSLCECSTQDDHIFHPW